MQWKTCTDISGVHCLWACPVLRALLAFRTWLRCWVLSALAGFRQRVRPFPTNMPACESIGKLKMYIKNDKASQGETQLFSLQAPVLNRSEASYSYWGIAGGAHNEPDCRETVGKMAGWGKASDRYLIGSGFVLASKACPWSYCFVENPILCSFQMSGKKVPVSVLRLSEGVLQQFWEQRAKFNWPILK